ncbi:uncharacterized protein BO80DRAFT_482533 [Aspergillus ibericus CBS 121593]|uniref:F-box domain-containing protein n=1 Tax=Aspergillus ibericus CBS 121593 TaxID=1448316 RepID=A0A395GPH5_9EURO|nr:hypothetical protein BO80DRAFT_482533 [Aspergillus ibericus CBS 121593]RAK97264.1 hypothetical protein BO80DRAFT_482533 [Aspergillus ibericus CBS 121593]
MAIMPTGNHRAYVSWRSKFTSPPSTQPHATVAPHSVFLITELLEAILLHVDPFTLLTSAQRVCHFWNTVIQHSHRLQIALFFQPSNNYIPTPHEPCCPENPFLTKLWYPIFFRRHLFTLSFPLLASPLTSKFVPHHIDVYLRREASWRRMLVFQRPDLYVRILELKSDGVEFTVMKDIVYHPAEGFPRLGPLYAFVRKKFSFTARRVFTLQRGFKPRVLERVYWVAHC